jgi:hypothetical protein
MKNSDQPIDRLLRAAGQYSPAVAVEEPPFGFTTRVVAGWLAGAGREGMGREAGLETLWFRRAFLCAAAVMVLSVGLSFKTDTAAPNDEMALVSYDATMDLP